MSLVERMELTPSSAFTRSLEFILIWQVSWLVWFWLPSHRDAYRLYSGYDMTKTFFRLTVAGTALEFPLNGSQDSRFNSPPQMWNQNQVKNKTKQLTELMSYF